MTAIRVLIVDDHALFAETLAARLAREPDLTVLQVATTARAAYAALATAHPDVVLVDLDLGGTSGLDVLDHVRRVHSRVRAVVLTAVTGVEPAVQAIGRGAMAWVPKSAGADAVVSAIKGVAAGEAWVPPGLLAGVLRRLVGGPRPGESDGTFVELSAREREVLQCMVDGRSRADTARSLGLSVNTVRTHTRNLLAKLDLHSGLEAAALALRAGMRPSAPAGEAAQR